MLRWEGFSSWQSYKIYQSISGVFLQKCSSFVIYLAKYEICSQIAWVMMLEEVIEKGQIIIYYYYYLKVKSSVCSPSKLTSNLQKCQGVHIHIGCHFQSRHFFWSMYVVAWQFIVFDEMWNIRNSLLFPPQKDDNWQGQGKGAEAVRKFWRFTRQSCTTSRYRCIVW